MLFHYHLKLRVSTDTEETVIANKEAIFLKLQPLEKQPEVDLDERPVNDFLLGDYNHR